MNDLNYTLKVMTSRFPRDDQAMKKNLNTGTADFSLPNLQDAELSSVSGILQLWRTDTVNNQSFQKIKIKQQDYFKSKKTVQSNGYDENICVTLSIIGSYIVCR